MTIKVLIQGHSFITRFKQFIRENNEHYSFSLNLSPQEFMVQYSGRPGGKVHHLWSDENITDFEPEIIILQCGSNDLCDHTVSPMDLRDKLIEYIHHLFNTCNVQRVIVMQILHRLEPEQHVRHRVDIEWFNNRVDTFNHLISDSLGHIPLAYFAKHRGLCDHHVLYQAMHKDGIHLNSSGYPKYFRNIRSALMACYNRLPHH